MMRTCLTDDDGPVLLVKGGISLNCDKVSGMTGRAHRFTAKLNYYGKPFASVPVEVSSSEAGNADHYDRLTSEALTFAGLPASEAVPCMTLSRQAAQKLHV